MLWTAIKDTKVDWNKKKNKNKIVCMSGESLKIFGSFLLIYLTIVRSSVDRASL